MSDDLTLELLSQCGMGGRPNYKGELPLNYCPFHEHNYRSPSISVNVTKKTFVCFACWEKGHIRRLFYHFGIETGDLYNFIKKESDFEIELNKLLADSELPEMERNNADPGELAGYRFLHPYLLERGFSREIIIRNRIGFDKNTVRATIPIFYKGKYYGTIKRTVLDVQPRYLYPDNLQKSAILYCPRPVELVDGTVEIWCEGSLSALRIAQAGYIAKAILGCQISLKQLKELESSKRRIILALDADDPGVHGTNDILQRTGRYDIDVFAYPAGVSDPGEATVEQIHEGVKNANNRLLFGLV